MSPIEQAINELIEEALENQAERRISQYLENIRWEEELEGHLPDGDQIKEDIIYELRSDLRDVVTDIVSEDWCSSFRRDVLRNMHDDIVRLIKDELEGAEKAKQRQKFDWKKWLGQLRVRVAKAFMNQGKKMLEPKEKKQA